jgi:hypothetical protein
MDTNWELIKFQYEILGSSVEDLAAEHEVSATVLEYNAKSWETYSFGRAESFRHQRSHISGLHHERGGPACTGAGPRFVSVEAEISGAQVYRS